MSNQLSTIALRGIACDIEDCDQPQSWADAMRAAASEIDKLRAVLQWLQDDLKKSIADYDISIAALENKLAALGEKE